MDIELQGLGGEVLGIGEVKGDGDGLYQLLAAMQAWGLIQDTWPVGFVADKAYRQLVETEKKRGCVTVTIAKYASDDLMQVLSFVEQLIVAVDSVSPKFPPPAKSDLTLSSSDSEEETRARVAGLEAEVKELRKDVKEISASVAQLATRFAQLGGRLD